MALRFVLHRRPSDGGTTIGDVTLDGDPFCYTCEDEIREVPRAPVGTWKVAGQTAIPQGVYSVIITPSARFKRPLPLVVNVPGFSGIRIHPGGSARDTEGCILPGLVVTGPAIFRSREACAKWQNAIQSAIDEGQSVTLEIVNPA